MLGVRYSCDDAMAAGSLVKVPSGFVGFHNHPFAISQRAFVRRR